MDYWTIKYYKTDSGKIPVLDYMELQEPERIIKIRNALRLLKEFGIEGSQIDARKIHGDKYKGLYELRIDSSRILYFLITGKIFVLVHGFTKKSNKTPKQELETARRRMKDYLGD
ncbi:MAG TPA: type II toxin-antitoxin system RelE/ParE family toxin [Actinobacteria bacterium]|nr:type II toxin-antitoxin system RelE/ParE family toxin [Actinomycetota bacterium]